MSSLDVVLLGFMMDMVDIITSYEIIEQTVPEQGIFDCKTMVYECKKID